MQKHNRLVATKLAAGDTEMADNTEMGYKDSTNADRESFTHEVRLIGAVVLSDVFTETQKYRLQRHLPRTRTNYRLITYPLLSVSLVYPLLKGRLGALILVI